MDTTHNRLARLRAEIAAGTYAPPADAVAEALVGWIARPEQFERSAPGGDDRADATGDRDQEGRG